MNTQTETVTLEALEQTVIGRLQKETCADIIDVPVIEALTKTLDIVTHHLKRRDDDLFRASNM
ncbi:hypothetical protein PJK55_00275 [Exiguobacterium sp. MMG028]|uniref:hypothetical protein n=1 Tax=Exiguobacterium sp. MMG028 TaxID=3021979 RepID=UPI0022FDEEDC|nr:hypothetical protein [Exiguobacterium sp. MMG028]MDA5559151.1 hypothetical protein [Exiguobacterium sp. MMG028]